MEVCKINSLSSLPCREPTTTINILVVGCGDCRSINIRKNATSNLPYGTVNEFTSCRDKQVYRSSGINYPFLTTRVRYIVTLSLGWRWLHRLHFACHQWWKYDLAFVSYVKTHALDRLSETCMDFSWIDFHWFLWIFMNFLLIFID